MKALALAGLIVLAVCTMGASCSTGFMRELAKDPATACVTITSIYGTVRVYRTAAVNATVTCSQDGMQVKGP